LLQPCFRELSELDVDQGTWVCIFSCLLVHGQTTSAQTPLNSTVKHYKLAIQVLHLLVTLGTIKVLSLVVFIHLSSMNSNWRVCFHSTLVTITQYKIRYKTKISHKHMVVIYYRNTPLPKVPKSLHRYKLTGLVRAQDHTWHPWFCWCLEPRDGFELSYTQIYVPMICCPAFFMAPFGEQLARPCL
jgi:hypothetical protein